MPGMVVRLATIDDVPRLAVVEQTVWGVEGTEVLRPEHFYAWLAVYPEGFRVVEHGGSVVAFSYMYLIHFDLNHLEWLTNFDAVTDHGYGRDVHRADGSHHFGVTMCSLVPGAGKLLLRNMLDFTAATARPLLGFSRMTGFADYVAAVCKERGLAHNLDESTENALALHYGLECAKMVGGKVHPRLLAGYQPGIWPPVSAVDPILRVYLRHPEFVLYAPLRKFMQDPKSRDYAFLFGQEPLV